MSETDSLPPTIPLMSAIEHIQTARGRLSEDDAEELDEAIETLETVKNRHEE